MKFYHIKDDYISFLKNFDNKVPDNKNEKRPYIGIVLDIKGIKYYAPFSSPKPKHQKMKNSKDFRKINHGLYGAINFNNMIPVVDSALIFFDINTIPDFKYRRLLQNQYQYIKNDSEQILKTAAALHTLIMTEDKDLSSHELLVKRRCCNLKQLETATKQYSLQHSSLP